MHPHTIRNVNIAVWVLAGVFYVAGGAYMIHLVLDEIARLNPEGSLRVPRCFRRRHLRYPLLFVWPGLLWPFFMVFAHLRWKLDERRLRNIDIELGNRGDNEGAAPPPAPPPAPLP